ncbi:CRISPR-associated protein, Csd2 family [Candidatus Arthromitus sp. SFB-mouse-SU]|uniref:type I-C CRISPR-associated protein Cas7/Csd2 n=1 Tax=unclassified Candidatus Neoarthromitus TaxID=2638829 RepID=UPI000229694D|nr:MULTISPECIES: type I-C CRISPR-associated protein Cas7/Csd2 [unclassified Candidatus Arthromitus]EIA26370.1 CRISPR-associated protein, Csd2 family [Candidatus Arthromitus sp. SFB-4]EIA26757.1 CRISPR-associated protein, Csd2 family [Candidatus Arthromitus sp. SFB-5]EIA28591.1 CRISPR-associated protein, Csd2 family [Candidatus Arthromitus sp. SFB-co]EIA30744.1 CRISPR-associated protein, Csd2 family [Candidatus Arthromitus sp. SFB-mouse-SU]AID44640.1 CRISPR-associated protein, Csd2/Csh2 family 
MLLSKRYEFVILFDVENGNPNGDPDSGNMPRIDPETGHGIVTDVCIKRKIRNYIEVVEGERQGFDIYVKNGAVLNEQHRKAYEAFELKPENKKLPKDEKLAKELTGYMCKNFYDIRSFGAVMSNEVNCGQVRGPIQLNFGRSIDPIFSQDLTITRCAVTNMKDLEKGQTMGRKQIVPYALYRMEGYVSAHLAQKVTGFNEEDLNILWQAIINMFEYDRSASHGKMATRKLYVFEHETALGNAPSHKLFDLIEVERKDKSKPSRHFNDYEISIDRDSLPKGVDLIEKL